MISEGASDQQIADALGLGRMAVQRHRHAHVFAPAQALATAAGKDREAVLRRADMMAAAEAGDPSLFVGLAAIVHDLRTVHERLERSAAAAEADKQRMAVSTLSAQQLRAAEVRAKLGAVGGYAPARQAADGTGAPVQIQMIFQGTGQVETITVGNVADPVVLDGEAEPTPDAPAEHDPRTPGQRALARAFRVA
jgi:hypothetical protein